MALEGGTIDQDKKKQLVWTDDMVYALLSLRLKQFNLVFDGSRSNQQLSVVWEKMTLRFNLTCNVSAESSSLKNKYQSLKSEYSRIRFASDNETGNLTDDPIRYPTYWESLVEFFGDKRGLGHVEFGSSDVLACEYGSDRSNSEANAIETSMADSLTLEIDYDEDEYEYFYYGFNILSLEMRLRE